MENKKYKALLAKYLKGTASKEEEKIFDSFFQSYQSNNDNWNQADLLDKELLKKEIYSSIKARTKENKSPVTHKIYTYIAAASVVILFISTFLLWRNNNRHQQPVLVSCSTNYGEQKIVTLSDGSQITLNAGSTLTYYEPFEKHSRQVELSGEAFFKVARDTTRPFSIKSEQITTTVLGTSFDIYAYPDEDISVTVLTGKVKVTSSDELPNNNSMAILTPGEQACFNKSNSTLSKREVDTKYFTSWQDHTLYFNQERVELILKKLERNYNQRFECTDSALLDKRVTTSYTNASIESTLNDLQFMLNFNYDIATDNTIKIYK